MHGEKERDRETETETDRQTDRDRDTEADKPILIFYSYIQATAPHAGLYIQFDTQSFLTC